jgi:poly(U)-specific endoribonuclease
MIDIYQQIWDADQASAGVQPILDTMTGDPQTGFVKVNSNLNEQNQDLRVLPEAVIPDSQKSTYDLCRHLFNNYALSERDVEVETPEEREEVHNLVQAMVDTAPMEVAREYVAQATGTSLSRERWYNTLMEMWFRRFSMGGDPHLSGFEHVVVGEQEGGKAQGYHFWYKYYLDDGFARQVDGSVGNFPGLTDDRIRLSWVTTGRRPGSVSAMCDYFLSLGCPRL